MLPSVQFRPSVCKNRNLRIMLGIQFRLLRYRLIFRIRRRRSDQDQQIINDCLSVSSLPCAFLYFRSPLLFVGGKLLLTISGLHIVGRKGGGGGRCPRQEN